MAPLAVNRKRKPTVKELSDASDAEHFPDGGLDLSSGDEEEDGGPVQESDSDEIYAFPEIDADSDTDEEGVQESPREYEDLSEGEDDERDDEGAFSDDDDLHIFPRAKTIISDITGQPKKVYPEIEPDYDSDSSTEDVRAFLMSVYFDKLTN